MMYYPPEWHEQSAVWFAYPHCFRWDTVSYQSGSRLEAIREFFAKLIDLVLDFQDVKLLFANEELLKQAEAKFKQIAINKKYKLETLVMPNEDIWIRDYGPFFVYDSEGNKLVKDFAFNAWGEKFPPWELDDEVPQLMAKHCGYQAEKHPMILEGGSLEFNGEDLILTTEQCLLNANRNPSMSKQEIEQVLKSEFSVNHIVWLKRGLIGDHTDGHIDDFARFIGPYRVVLCKTTSTDDPNYEHLQASYEQLKNWRHPENGKALEIISLPLPEPMKIPTVSEPLPCSYANFIFVNGALIVPIFKSKYDDEALAILQKAMPEHKVIGIDARMLIEEGGGIHCMSKQEPK